MWNSQYFKQTNKKKKKSCVFGAFVPFVEVREHARLAKQYQYHKIRQKKSPHSRPLTSQQRFST